MYQPLAPCSGCRRHVRTIESACPFCGAAMRATAVDQGPVMRMSRAALVAAGLAIAGCQSEPAPIPVAKDPAAVKPGSVKDEGSAPTAPISVAGGSITEGSKEQRAVRGAQAEAWLSSVLKQDIVKLEAEWKAWLNGK